MKNIMTLKSHRNMHKLTTEAMARQLGILGVIIPIWKMAPGHLLKSLLAKSPGS